MAYNPNDCVELRWGAPEKSHEASTCKRRARRHNAPRWPTIVLGFMNGAGHRVNSALITLWAHLRVGTLRIAQALRLSRVSDDMELVWRRAVVSRRALLQSAIAHQSLNGAQ